MNFLLDTNAISEWVKPRPNLGLVRWLESLDEDRTFISVISLAEIRYGIDRLPPGTRRKQLDDWLRRDLIARFEARILAIDEKIGEAWGKAVAAHEAVGRPIGAMDAFLAATAEVHGLTLVTRNASHFPLLKSVLNPWTS